MWAPPEAASKARWGRRFCRRIHGAGRVHRPARLARSRRRRGRVAVSADGIAGITGGFQVQVTAGIPVVVERAMYWPGAVGLTAAGTLTLTPEFDAVGLTPALARPQPYTSLFEAVPAGPTSLARAGGRVSPEEAEAIAAAGAVPLTIRPYPGMAPTS